jgi:hypothetical protein
MISTCRQPSPTNDTAYRERVRVVMKEINEAFENLLGDVVAQSAWKRLNSFGQGGVCEVYRTVELSSPPLETMD